MVLTTTAAAAADIVVWALVFRFYLSQQYIECDRIRTHFLHVYAIHRFLSSSFRSQCRHRLPFTLFLFSYNVYTRARMSTNRCFSLSINNFHSIYLCLCQFYPWIQSLYMMCTRLLFVETCPYASLKKTFSSYYIWRKKTENIVSSTDSWFPFLVDFLILSYKISKSIVIKLLFSCRNLFISWSFRMKISLISRSQNFYYAAQSDELHLSHGIASICKLTIARPVLQVTVKSFSENIFLFLMRWCFLCNRHRYTQQFIPVNSLYKIHSLKN